MVPATGRRGALDAANLSLKVLEKKQLNQQTTLLPHLITKLTVELLSKGQNSWTYVIYVELFNAGDKAVKATLNGNTLSLLKVEFNEGGIKYADLKRIGSSRYDHEGRLQEPFIKVGSKERYQVAYITKIYKPGTYLFAFLSELDEKLMNESADAELGKFGRYAAAEDVFIHVK